MIEVLVAGGIRDCSVHGSFLCEQSAQIAAAVAESERREDRYRLDLSDHDVETVEDFLGSIYQPGVVTLPADPTERYLAIVRLFAVAEQQQCRRLMEKLVQAFFDHVKTAANPPCVATLDLAYSRLQPKSTGRWMVTHACVWHRNATALANMWSEKKLKLRTEVSATLCMRYVERYGGRTEKNPFHMDAVTYCWLIKPDMKISKSEKGLRESLE